MYLSYFFRYRRVSLVPTLAIASAYYVFFENANNIMYKLIVDREVIRQARALGLSAQVQPVGTFKNRGLNYVWGTTFEETKIYFKQQELTEHSIQY